MANLAQLYSQTVSDAEIKIRKITATHGFKPLSFTVQNSGSVQLHVLHSITVFSGQPCSVTC